MPEFLNDINDIEVLLALMPEEVAPIVLRTAEREQENGRMSLDHIIACLYKPGQEPSFPQDRRKEVEESINEGWYWLFRNGLTVPEPGINGRNGFMIPTRAGNKLLANPGDFDNFIADTKFPKALLHPIIADEVWATLVRGELELAVFIAFKAVEVAVRDASNFNATDIGVSLMRKAFDKTTGPLIDGSQPDAERDALAHLFAGAIGSYKNPFSHRTTTITDPRDAHEMVMLASHLLGIVDARR